MPGHDLQRLTGRRPTPPLIQINPAFVQRYLPHHNPEDNLHLELNTLYPSAGSSPSVTTFAMSPYSSSSLSLASLSAPQSPDGGDTCWNLIPYDVPWGSDYYAYKAGSLPGPEGDCLFLRSPTPVDKRRTVRACEKCRERKAKCSGDRPTCVRCLEKGRVCVYTSDSRRVKAQPVSKSRRARTREHDVSASVTRRQDPAELGSPASTMSSLEGLDTISFATLSPKREHEERVLPLFSDPQLAEPTVFSVDVKYAETTDDRAWYQPQSPSQTHPAEYYDGPDHTSIYRHVTGNGELVSLPPYHTSSLAPAIVAPKPRRCGPSPLSMAETRDAAAPRSYHTTAQWGTVSQVAEVDPSTLGHGHEHATTSAPCMQSAVECFSGDAAPPILPSSLMAASQPSISPYQPPFAQTRDAYASAAVSIYADSEIYGNPAASQLSHLAYVPYSMYSYPAVFQDLARQD